MALLLVSKTPSIFQHKAIKSSHSQPPILVQPSQPKQHSSTASAQLPLSLLLPNADYVL